MIQKNKKLNNQHYLCKKCKEKPRYSLYFCKECLRLHNKQTRELKRKYRKNKKCVMCGKPSITRRCETCTKKEINQQKNRPYSKAKKSKAGIYGSLKQLSEVL